MNNSMEPSEGFSSPIASDESLSGLSFAFTRTLPQTTESIGGGFSQYHAREKFVGVYGKDVTLEALRTSVESYQGIFVNTTSQEESYFRVCARVYINEQELSALARDIEDFRKLHPDLPLELEYYYHAGGADSSLLVAGIGSNGPARFESHRYDGHRVDAAHGAYPQRPSCRRDIEALESEAKKQPLVIKENFNSVHSFAELNQVQRGELQELLSRTFGIAWTSEAVDSHDSAKIPTRVLIDPVSGVVVGVAIAEADEHTIEVTEWAALPGVKGAGLRVMRDLVCGIQEDSRFAKKTIYGEFNLTSASTWQALKLGFSVPEQLESVEAQMMIPANVKVKGKLTDFAVLVFNTAI